MKFFITIAFAFIALASQAQSAVTATINTTLANDHIALVGTTVFTQKASENSKMFTMNSTGAAKRLYITNVATDEVLVSNTLEISNAFSTENNDLLLSPISVERTILEIETLP